MTMQVETKTTNYGDYVCTMTWYDGGKDGSAFNISLNGEVLVNGDYDYMADAFFVSDAEKPMNRVYNTIEEMVSDLKLN